MTSVDTTRLATVGGAPRFVDDAGQPVRLSPAAMRAVPADTAGQARYPVGLHLRAAGGARTTVRFRLADPDPACGWANTTVATWHGADLLSEEEVRPGTAELDLDLTRVTGEVHVYPPLHMTPRVLDAREVLDDRPVWLAYGDSITGAWSCPTPGGDWVSRAARTLGVEAVNLGFAGAARGELAAATDVASLRADLVTIAFGTNCWAATPHSAAGLRDVVEAFLAEVRRGHPTVPVAVVSPIVRPAAEETANEHGATLQDLRRSVESATRARIDAGDRALTLIPGLDVLPESGLCADLIHPGTPGHAHYAEALVPALRTALEGARS